jgi:hypothetical protein
MARHEHPQASAPIFYPAGHPLHNKQPTPAPASDGVKQSAQQASVNTSSGAQDLGEVVRGIVDLAAELSEAFYAVPDVTREDFTVDPEKFDTATRYALVACGNALDYAIRLFTEKGRGMRIIKLRKELAEEMRAAGMTGDPFGEPPGPQTPEQVG